MKKFIPWLLIATVVFITNLPAQDSFALDERVPENTAVYVSFPDLGQACRAFKKTAIWQLGNDQELKQLIGNAIESLDKEIKKALEEGQKELGMDPRELAKVFCGEVSVAVVSAMPPSVVVRLEYGERRAVVEKILEKVQIPFTKQSLGDLDAYMVQGVPMPVSFAHYQNGLVVASDPSLLQQVCAGKHAQPLTGSAVYQKARFKVQSDFAPVFFTYVNAKVLLALLEPQIPAHERKNVEEWGLFDIHTLAFAVNLNGDYVHDAFYLGTSGKPRGIIKLLQGKPVSQDIVKVLPKNTISFTAFSLDLQELLANLKGLVSKIPPGQMVLGEYAKFNEKMKSKIGFSIEDISLFLGSDHYVIKYLEPHDDLMPFSIGVSTLKNKDLFLKCMVDICNQMTWDLKKLDYSGQTLYYVSRKLGKLGTNPFEKLERLDGSGPKQLQAFRDLASFIGSGMAFYLEDNKVYWAFSMQTLKHFLENRKNPEKLVNCKDFQQVFQYVPKDSSFITYMDLRTVISMWWDTILPIAGMFEGYMRAFGVPFDSALIPDGETMGQYFKPSIMYQVADADGITFQTHSVIGRSVYLVVFAAGAALGYAGF